MIEYCDNRGLYFRLQTLGEGNQYLFVLEKLLEDGNTVELEHLFQISQFDNDDNIEVDRLFDIIDRTYSLLKDHWRDWTRKWKNLSFFLFLRNENENECFNYRVITNFSYSLIFNFETESSLMFVFYMNHCPLADEQQLTKCWVLHWRSRLISYYTTHVLCHKMIPYSCLFFSFQYQTSSIVYYPTCT